MSVLRVRRAPGGVDEYGDPIDSTAETVDVPGAFTAPRESEDTADRGRAGVIVGLWLFAPFDFEILRTDQIDVDGQLYEIEGESGKWEQPHTGWKAGQQLALRRAEG